MSSSNPHQIFKGSQDGGGDDAQENTQDVQYHAGPEQPVQVDDVPAASHSRKLEVMCRVTGPVV